MVEALDARIEQALASYSAGQQDLARAAIEVLKAAGDRGLTSMSWSGAIGGRSTPAFVESVAETLSFCIWVDHLDRYVFGETGDEPDDAVTELDLDADLAAFSHTRVVSGIYATMAQGPFRPDDIAEKIVEQGFSEPEAFILADTLIEQFRAVDAGNGLLKLRYQDDGRSGFQILADILVNPPKPVL